MATLRTSAAQEKLRAARDARYRANVECAITQVRRIVVLVAVVVTLASMHTGTLACSVGSVWGAREIMLRPCDHARGAAAGNERAPTR